MAKAAKPLTEVAIRKLKRPKSGKPARLYDGHGLFFVRGVHRDVWKLRMRENGRDRWQTLGEYPAMSLKEARDAAEEARSAIARGEAVLVTFEEAAMRWLDHAGRDWAHKTRRDALSWFRADVFPYIGGKRLDDIQAPDVLALLRRIEAAGNLYKVRRLHSYIRRVFAFAISHGDAKRNPAAELNPRDLFEKEKRKHHPAFTTRADAGRLMRLIREYPQPVTRGALMMLAWTLSRPGEVRMMRWADIDRERAQWRYIVSKTNTPHAVPLPRQAMALLDELEPLTGQTPLVFHGARPGRPLSDNTLNQALRTMGIDTKTQHCAHGFRAMGRTLLAELGYKPEAMERQLCHKQPNDVVAAYARETLLDERTAMVQAWADTLDAWADGAEVIPLRRSGEA